MRKKKLPIPTHPYFLRKVSFLGPNKSWLFNLRSRIAGWKNPAGPQTAKDIQITMHLQPITDHRCLVYYMVSETFAQRLGQIRYNTRQLSRTTSSSPSSCSTRVNLVCPGCNTTSKSIIVLKDREESKLKRLTGSTEVQQISRSNSVSSNQIILLTNYVDQMIVRHAVL